MTLVRGTKRELNQKVPTLLTRAVRLRRYWHSQHLLLQLLWLLWPLNRRPSGGEQYPSKDHAYKVPCTQKCVWGIFVSRYNVGRQVNAQNQGETGSMIQPTIGRVVYFHPAFVPDSGTNEVTHAAIVTYVHGDTCINLAVCSTATEYRMPRHRCSCTRVMDQRRAVSLQNGCRSNSDRQHSQQSCWSQLLSPLSRPIRLIAN